MQVAFTETRSTRLQFQPPRNGFWGIMEINTVSKIYLDCTILQKLDDLQIKDNNLLNNCFLKYICMYI